VFCWFSILFAVDGWVDGMDGLGGWMGGMEGGRKGRTERQTGGWVG
jgi:hypothetical protein